LKVVLSWRVNGVDDIPRVGQEHLLLFHADEAHEGRKHNAVALAHWLKPLNMKELEGAWRSFAVKSPKTHKPPFSFEDLCVYDRSLAERLKNPLMLRLFLELFHGRPLPRRMGEIDIWGMYYRNLTSI
jgi:hypothetical protein